MAATPSATKEPKASNTDWAMSLAASAPRLPSGSQPMMGGQLAPPSSVGAAVDPGRLMKLVAKNAKRGAQFTPQGVLKFPIAAVKPDEVLAAVRGLLENLADRALSTELRVQETR